MDNQQLEKTILKSQLEILRKLNDRIEEGEDFLSAWIDIRSELIRKLKKLEA